MYQTIPVNINAKLLVKLDQNNEYKTIIHIFAFESHISKFAEHINGTIFRKSFNFSKYKAHNECPENKIFIQLFIESSTHHLIS